MDLFNTQKFRFALAGLCGLILLSAMVTIAMAVMQPKPSYFIIGFEAVSVFACVFGVLLARGKFREGPAIGILCVAAAVGVGSLLGAVGSHYAIGSFGLKPWLLGRVGCAGLLAAMAGAVVVARSPSLRVPALLKGSVLGALTIAVGYGVLVASKTMSGAMAFIAAVGLGLVCVGLLCASVHYLIAAFTPSESEVTA